MLCGRVGAVHSCLKPFHYGLTASDSKSFTAPMGWLFHIFSSATFLTAVVLTIPLAFDVGGRLCGLAFSLSLATFYFLFSILKLSTPDDSRFRNTIIQLVRWTQFLIIPSLLIWALGRFSVDAESTSWVERTFTTSVLKPRTFNEKIFGPDGWVETATIGTWEKLLRWSTPVFQLAEGFCSLLVIQAAGQLTKWLVNRGERSDSWLVSFDPDCAIFSPEADTARSASLFSLRRRSPARFTSSGVSFSSKTSTTWMPFSSAAP